MSTPRASTDRAEEAEGGSAPIRLVVETRCVVVLDDDGSVRCHLVELLSHHGMRVLLAEGVSSARELLERERVDVALVDLAHAEYVLGPTVETEVVVMTLASRADAAMNAWRAGAYQVLLKPFRSAAEVVFTVERAAERRGLIERARVLAERLEDASREPSGVPSAPVDATTAIRASASSETGALPYREAKQQAVAAFDRSYFEAVLRRTSGNVSEAARQAGLDRSNFRRAARRAGGLVSR